MVDQTHQLKLNNAKAATLTGALGRSGIDRVLENACLGQLDFLYLSPERLEDPMFKARTNRLDVRTIVVDEAHCISAWGHDFRPEYSKISQLKSIFPAAAWGAYTATATKDVLDDIKVQLQLKNAVVFTQPARRKNLAFQINSWGDPEIEILHQAIRLDEKYPTGSGLIYVRTRAKADKFAQRLISLNINAQSFHAGLSSDTKQKRQRNWVKNKTKVMVCTSAFGMGIDKADVRWVLHFDLPNTLEAYAQEAGRAGRDGFDSECIAFTDRGLKAKNSEALTNQFPTLEVIQSVYQNIANQGRIAIGDKPEKATEFLIDVAIDKLKISRTAIKASLNTLQKRGYLEVNEPSMSNGSVVWLGGKNRVLNEEKTLNSRISNTVMRMSTSPTYEIEVNLKSWSSMHSCKSDDLLNSLVSLDACGLIDWKPNSGNLKIVWTTSRIKASKVTLDLKHRKSRIEHLRAKLKSVHDYSESPTCRAFDIDLYFEPSTKKYTCGSCDNCTIDVDSIKTALTTAIPSNGVNAYKLIRGFPAGHRHEVSSILRTMLASKKIYAEGTMVFNLSVA